MGGRNAEWNEPLTKNGSSLFSTLWTAWYSCAGLLEQVTRFDLKWETEEFSMDFCPIVGELVNPQTTSRESQQPKWIYSSWISDIRNIHDGCYHVLNFSLDSFHFHHFHTHSRHSRRDLFGERLLLSAFTFSWLPQDDRDVHNHLAMMTSTLLSLSRQEPLLSLISLFSFITPEFTNSPNSPLDFSLFN